MNQPSQLDDSLVGSSVHVRWETYGWQLGRVTCSLSDIVTDGNSTPIACTKSSSDRIVWADCSKGPAA